MYIVLHTENDNPGNTMNCFVAVYKPYGWTSHDVVDRVRKLTGIKKVGHAGTLDPRATGVLIVAIGRDATKRIDTFTDLSKRYEATFSLKAFSETDDSEGPLYPVNIKNVPTKADVDAALQTFVGEQEQIPPRYSSVKVEGLARHKAARSGHKDIALPTRDVTIYSIHMLWFRWPYVAVEISCSKGTYIRSIARDLGHKLGAGGYVYELVRTAVGPYTLEEAYDISKLDTLHEAMCLPE